MIAPHIAQWALNKRKADEGERVAAVVATRVENINDTRKKPIQRIDERVLETKGGGGYQPPPQPSARELAEARDWEAQKEFDREQKRQDAIDAAAKIEKDAKDAGWLTSKNAAYTGAQTAGKNKLTSMGLASGDQYGVYDQYMSALDTANAGLQQGADYSSAFSGNVLDELLGSARTGQRNKYSTAFNQAVSPYYAEDRFGSTADDTILSSILDTQYQDALADLTSARDRGQATSSVYDRALRDLDTAKYSANADLQSIGGGVLQDIIGDIGTRRQGSLDSAAAWDYGATYDPAAEAARITGYADERGSTLEGDIRAALGGKEYFDTSSLLGKAKAKVGGETTGTTGTSALLDTFENEATKKDEDTKAGEGVF